MHITSIVYTSLHTVPTPTVTISPSGPIQGTILGNPQFINCTVSTVSGVESSSVMISWMGPGGVITNDRRVTISLTTSSGNTYTSSLQFTYLMEGDEGMYICNVIILETSGSQSVKMHLMIGMYVLNIGLGFLKLLLSRKSVYICVCVCVCVRPRL